MAHVIIDSHNTITQIQDKPTIQSVWLDDNDPRIHVFLKRNLALYKSTEQTMLTELIQILIKKRVCIVTDFSVDIQKTLPAIFDSHTFYVDPIGAAENVEPTKTIDDFPISVKQAEFSQNHQNAITPKQQRDV